MNSIVNIPYYWWDSAISPEVCEGIIEEGNRLELKTAGIKDDKTIKKETRTTEVGFFDDEHYIEGLCKHFITLANKGANWNFDLNSNELVQFGKYMPGSFYLEHRDSDVETFSNRKLSISVQLSAGERYSGGDFRMRNLYGESLDLPKGLRNQGSVIVFPSILLHEVTKVRAGARYSLVQWHSGPEFK